MESTAIIRRQSLPLTPTHSQLSELIQATMTMMISSHFCRSKWAPRVWGLSPLSQNERGPAIEKNADGGKAGEGN